MSPPHIQEQTTEGPIIGSPPLKQYLVVRQEDAWFIRFGGESFGPYLSDREALLFAVDAANKLGGQGQGTQVLVIDENGDTQPAWTFGHDPYPPRLS